MANAVCNIIMLFVVDQSILNCSVIIILSSGNILFTCIYGVAGLLELLADNDRYGS